MVATTTTVFEHLADMGARAWDGHFAGNTGLQHDVLHLTEVSRLNDLRHSYLLLEEEGEVIGRANVYRTAMDFTTMDKGLPAEVRGVLRRWYPSMLVFDLLECGQFTTIGEGLQPARPEQLRAALQATATWMDERAGEDEFLLVRDVPWERYEAYREVLRPRGYLPVCGFPNASLDITWASLDEYLASLDSKTRYKLRHSLDNLEKLEISVHVTSDFAGQAAELERLWLNVNAAAAEYKRERLNQAFFAACAASGRAEIVRFEHQGRLIAFMLNLIGEQDYVMLDWGVDYTFQHYRQANLYRAASLLSLRRAVELGKQRLELGITNYVPKALLGARVSPLVYFIKHSREPWKTRTLAKLIAENITQPDELSWPEASDGQSAGVALRQRIACDQSARARTDVFDRCEQASKFDVMRLAGIYGLYPEFKSAQRPRVVHGASEMVLLGTNSYLGLATHPRVIEAAQAALARYGSGCSGSPLLNGTLDLHVQLETELAAFVGKPSAMICSTGYQSNLAALSAVAGPNDLLVLDARCHRSLFDGDKLSGAEFSVYGHQDVGHLRRLLERRRDRRVLIVTDSVFSMEGTIAPLRALVDLAQEFGARLYVDESHALGVLGPTGAGAAEAQGVLDRVDLVMGTFSKSLAAVGGFVAGSREVIDHLRHHGAGHVFSASLPPPVVGAALAALDIIRTQPELRHAVVRTAERAAERLVALGYHAEFHGAPIVPVVFGNSTLALAAYKQFMGAGVYVNPVGPPAVPEERAGFRTSYMATHGEADIDAALAVFARFKDDLGRRVPRAAEAAAVSAAAE